MSIDETICLNKVIIEEQPTNPSLMKQAVDMLGCGECEGYKTECQFYYPLEKIVPLDEKPLDIYA